VARETVLRPCSYLSGGDTGARPAETLEPFRRRCGSGPGGGVGPGPVGARGWLGTVDEVGGRGGEDGPMFFLFPQIGSI
jgi:hypothetical protein